MAALNFPTSPSIGQTYTANGKTWTWDGTTWQTTNAVAAGDVSNTPAGNIAATNVQTAINELDSEKVAVAGLGTGVATALGNTVNGASGLVVLDGSSKLPAVDGSQLTNIAAGATGGSTDKTFWVNDQTITADYTVATGKNAGTFGPVTINAGITVTISSGSTWSVV